MKRIWNLFILAAALVILCAVPAGVLAQQGGPGPGPGPVQVNGSSFVPERIPFSEDLLDDLNLPEGFEVNVFARGLANPRMITVGDDGTVYVTQPEENQVTALRDTDGDGAADEEEVVVSGIEYLHGITYHNGSLYLATPKEVYVAVVGPDGSVGDAELLIGGLPDGGQHPNRTLRFGPDGRLYLSVGSSCNACPEQNPEHATMLQINGTERRIYARGLRNTIGFDWHPGTGELWAFDQGSDWRGPDQPPEELNRIQDGGNYGWPWCFGKQQVDTVIAQDPPNMTREEYCAMTVPSYLEYQAHSSPMQFLFYDSEQFPEEYRNDAILTLRGSWNRYPPVGYKVVRVQFNDAGEPEGFEDFMTGFLHENGTAFSARLCGLAIGEDGSLLVGDDTNGVIYRVSYAGANNTTGR
jgi:glucose/arabinose dehydrogenase